MSQDHYNTGFESEEASEFENLLTETQERFDATKGQRLANYVIDRAIIFSLFLLIGSYMGRSNTAFAAEWLGWILVLVIMFTYYIFFEKLFGKTPGKMFTQTLVISEEGEKPTLGQIVGRTFGRIIPFIELSFVFGNTGWHDSISQTRVIKQPNN